jgi:pullulanase
MKKLLIFVLMILSAFSLVSYVKADQAVSEIYIHYYRYGGDYDNWNVWAWQSLPESLEGSDYDFVEDETAAEYNFGGVVTVIDIDEVFPDITTLGFIVRRGDWAEKDIDADRTVDIPAMTTNGQFHIYLVEGDTRVGTSLTDEDGPDKSPKFKNAYFTDLDKIYFSTTEEITGASVVVKEDDVAVTIVDVEIDGMSGNVTIGNDLDFSKSYTIEATFPSDSSVNDYDVTFDGIYDSDEFEEAFGYEGNDLGAVVGATKTSFRLWAPVSQSVKLNIYDTGTPLSLGGTDTPVKTVDMVKDVKGTFYHEENGNLHGKYYTYSVTNGSITSETIDPYAKSAGVNGIRGMVVDFSQVNPTGFTYDNRPDNMVNATDAIIYELHVRDLTSHSSWNGSEINRGKFLGLTESGTTYQSFKTGFDHIVDLGVTHVQILPFFDFGVVDESKLGDADYNSFNWGYMPLNFNVPEGSYSSNPYDGVTRVEELKQMIMEFAEEDIRINMDVVYNHHGLTANSNFELIVPGYYFRKTSSGAFSNGSGTGNETASERVMMRKFMIDSVKFWAYEYNISGFRFDLMALHDTETMILLEEALHEIDDSIMVYGEPWMGGTSPLPSALQGGKMNLAEMATVGAFNDDLRDAVKGSVFAREQGGFIQGDYSANNIMRIKYGIVGGTAHQAITGSNLTAQKVWHTSPLKTINYVTAHDNNVLHDKLYLTLEKDEKIDLIPALQKQANAIVLTAQGISFLHAGDEILRTKPLADGDGFDHNSYESPDSTNQIRWDLITDDTTQNVYNYYKGLIALRKSDEAFRMISSAEINDKVVFVDEELEGLIAFEVIGDEETILVIHNAYEDAVKVSLPEGLSFRLVVNGEEAGVEDIATYTDGEKIEVTANSTFVLYKNSLSASTYDFKLNSGISFGVIIGVISGVVVIAAGAVVYFVILKRK